MGTKARRVHTGRGSDAKAWRWRSAKPLAPIHSHVKPLCWSHRTLKHRATPRLPSSDRFGVELITAEVCDIISNARRFGVATASGVNSQAPARQGLASAYATLWRRFRVRCEPGKIDRLILGPEASLGKTLNHKLTLLLLVCDPLYLLSCSRPLHLPCIRGKHTVTAALTCCADFRASGKSRQGCG
ncbi:unnamed protein product [Pleuronectes platessa]|uniref:Uncharacterized protein n=1 Tax=Pleuronectes platessa TaxID=8262 RepID=A0A9N7TK24_PLEPL|nr:unnamed protein product [Pleuronectes platessa]